MNKPTSSKKPTEKKVAVKAAPSIPKKLELKAGLVCKCGKWMIESIREKDGMYIIIPTEANKNAFGRVPMSEDKARELMEK